MPGEYRKGDFLKNKHQDIYGRVVFRGKEAGNVWAPISQKPLRFNLFLLS